MSHSHLLHTSSQILVDIFLILEVRIFLGNVPTIGLKKSRTTSDSPRVEQHHTFIFFILNITLLGRSIMYVSSLAPSFTADNPTAKTNYGWILRTMTHSFTTFTNYASFGVWYPSPLWHFEVRQCHMFHHFVVLSSPTALVLLCYLIIHGTFMMELITQNSDDSCDILFVFACLVGSTRM